MPKSVVILISHDWQDTRPDIQDSQRQLEEISQALKSLGYEVTILSFMPNFGEMISSLERSKPDFVFNLVESVSDQESLSFTAQAILELLEIPFTGSNASSMIVSSNKLISKKILQSASIKIPKYFLLSEIEEKFEEGTKYIVKSFTEHGSVGIDSYSVSDRKSVIRKLMERKEFHGNWFAEEYIEGREINVSILQKGDELMILPIAEILFENFPENQPKIIDYAAKWLETSFAYQNTKRSFSFTKKDQKMLEEIQEIALKAFCLFGLQGYARIDFRIDSRDRIFLLEANANPCLSSDAGFIAAAMEIGLDQCQVIKIISENLCQKNYL